jgi:hypothetical protein
MTTYSTVDSASIGNAGAVRKVTGLPHAIGGKGMIVLDTDAGLILIADLLAGSVRSSI